MHVISKKALTNFWQEHPESMTPLLRWYKLMSSHDFMSFHDLRNTLPSADMVGDFVVFNIGGNNYRLIAVIHFNRQKLYIRHVLTHAEYDKGTWKS